MGYQDKLKPVTATSTGYASKLKPVAEPPKKPSALKEFGKSLLNAPAKIAATAAQASASGAALLGNKQANLASQRFANEGVNLPFVGKVKPIGSPVEAAGVGLEAASFLPIARAPSTVPQLLKGKVLQGATRGALEGAGAGALMGAGTELQAPEASAGSVAKSTIKGGLIGTAAGAALGSALPAIPALKAGRAITNEEKVSNAIRQVLQGDTKDFATGREVLSSIDPSSVKTYADLRKRVGDRITTISEKHDEVLATNPTKKKLKDLNLTTTVGGQSLKQNYVQQALDQLGEFYAKTNNAEGRLTVDNLKRKASIEGLTVKEINEIAKRHGSELNAYNASGELASGLTKQAAENTRAGVKATVRDLFGNNISKAADAEVTKLIRVRDLADDMVEKVNTLQGKVKARSMGEKVGRLAAQALDILTAGTLKSFGRTLLVERGAGTNTLNALDLERLLQKNLRLIQKASKDGASEDDIIASLEAFIRANGAKPQSATPPKALGGVLKTQSVPTTPAPLKSVLPAESSANGILTGIKDKAKKAVADLKSIPRGEAGFIKNPLVKGKDGLPTLKSLTMLEKEVKTPTVSKQFLLDLSNRAELKQPERDLLRKFIDEEGDVVDVANFSSKVKSELLPLTTGKPSDFKKGLRDGEEAPQTWYENVVLPDEQRGPIANYSERIYQSPISTSAGDVHFQKNNAPNYFAHTRIEDLPLSDADINPAKGGRFDNYGDWSKPMSKEPTRRVIEIQSDLFQKGNLERENKPLNIREGVSEEDWKMHGFDKDAEKRAEELAKLEPYRNTWWERIVREEVKQAAKDGKTKLQFPTGETAMKIERLGQQNHAWITKSGGNSPLTPDTLKVGEWVRDRNGNSDWIITDVLGDGKFKAVPKSRYEYDPKTWMGTKKEHDEMVDAYSETFDISGKVDTNHGVYRRYEKNIGPYLMKKYGGKVVTDPQGVKWIELDVPKDAARLPVEAFGLGAIPTALSSSMLPQKPEPLNK